MDLLDRNTIWRSRITQFQPEIAGEEETLYVTRDERHALKEIHGMKIIFRNKLFLEIHPDIKALEIHVNIFKFALINT